MSSEIANTTSEIPPRSPEVKQNAAVSPNGTLNPNAAVFNHLRLMTLSDKSPGPQTSTTATTQWQENAEEPNSPVGAMADGLQYSPLAVNGYGESYTSPSPTSDMSQPQELSPDKLPLNELKVLLQRQLEYYFSRENLSRDTYLVSQMDGDNFVPIWTVANFNQIKKMTKDIELVKEVLRESPLLQMNNLCDKVRANVKRCIVVLREIPESTPIEEVKALFEGDGCPKLIKCEFVSNDYWYIFFENEECAQKAYKYLREVVKVFKGKPIMARIKANTTHQTTPKSVPPTPPQMDSAVITPPPPHQPPMYSRFQFPPVQPMFNNAQQYPAYFPGPPGMMHTWPPPNQPYQDQHMQQGFPPNGYNPVPLKGKHDKPVGNAIRHSFQPNRQRYPNSNKNIFRDQTNDRVDRDGSHRPKSQSTNGTIGSIPPTSSSSVASSVGNTSNTGTTTNSTANRENSKNTAGSFRNREGRDVDEFSRRNSKPLRRRRGSSEDIRRESRHKETRSSPVRHSKDDSDTVSEVLAPSNFPPLPTGKKQPETSESKSVPSKVEKPISTAVQSPAPWSKITENATVQNRPKPEAAPTTKPVEKPVLPKEPVIKPEKSPPVVSEKPSVSPQQTNASRQAEKMSYAQMAAQRNPKPTCNSSPPSNNQTKSPGK